MKQIGFWDGTEPFKITGKVRLIELFAGIGSQAKALERLGIDFEHYRVCEFDRFAIQSYNAIHGTDFSVSDITRLKGADLGIVETDKYTYIMTYSFPCQDLSKAGKQAGMGKGTRSGLLWEVERLLNETDNLPQVLLMENVPDVIGTKFMPDFAKWFEYLESRGYKNYYQVLNAKDYGIPQNRERCFMVSLLGDYYYDFPGPIPLELRLKDVLETEVDEKYYLSDAAVEKILTHIEQQREKGNGFGAEPQRIDGICQTLCARDYKGPPCIQEVKILEPQVMTPKRTEHGKAVRKAYENGEHKESRHTMTELEPREDGVSNTLTTVQKDNLLLEPCIGAIRGRNPNNPSDRTAGVKTQQTLEINQSGASNTLTTVQKDNVVVEPKQRIRKLTPLEYWRLMGFDDADHEKAVQAGVSNSQLYKQAGNSIVVNVLEAIFKEMF